MFQKRWCLEQIFYEVRAASIINPTALLVRAGCLNRDCREGEVLHQAVNPPPLPHYKKTVFLVAKGVLLRFIKACTLGC